MEICGFNTFTIKIIMFQINVMNDTFDYHFIENSYMAFMTLICIYKCQISMISRPLYSPLKDVRC